MNKQVIIAQSSTEAEYVSSTEECKEVLWLRSLQEHMGGAGPTPTQFFENNQSCIMDSWMLAGADWNIWRHKFRVSHMGLLLFVFWVVVFVQSAACTGTLMKNELLCIVSGRPLPC